MDTTSTEWDDEHFEAPESLKGMIISEVDIIRDSMEVVKLFSSQYLFTGLKLFQELDSKTSTTDNKS